MPSEHQQSQHTSPQTFWGAVGWRIDEARTAIAFFTRLPSLIGGYFCAPSGMDLSSADHGRLFQQSFWAAPVAGLCVGLLSVLGAWLAGFTGLSALSALAALAVASAVTGGLHEDGLADLADACGGGSRARRLEIMKDSRTGSFGVVALALWFLAAWICLDALAAHSTGILASTILIAAIVSRGLLPLAITALPSASSSGLGASAKGAENNSPSRASWLCALISLGLSTITIAWGQAWIPLVWLVVFQGATYALAYRLIGGATGDVFGAAQKMGELGIYIGMVALLNLEA